MTFPSFVRRLVLACLAFLGTGGVLEAQQQSTAPIPPTELRMLPPSPEAAKLGHYGTVPTGYYTGSVQLNVPLVTLQDGALQLPVSLSYNSTGNKVEELASWVGLGWTLSAGGAVTRVTRGWADDAPLFGNGLSYLQLIQRYTLAELTTAPASTRADYYYKLSHGCWDGEADVFSFNVNGYTGQFCFGWDGKLAVQCNRNVRIEPGFDARRVITSWRLIGDDGTVYTFAAQEVTTDRRGLAEGYAGCKPFLNSFISAWYLSSIEDVNREHRLTFEYDPYLISHGVQPRHSMRFGSGSDATMCPVGPLSNGSSRELPLDHEALRLRRIYASTGAQIVFTAGALRTDLIGLTGTNNTDLRSLAQVALKDPTGRTVESYTMSHGYGTGRLTLLGVQQTANGQQLPPYRFAYAGGMPTDLRSTSQDHWGYYNGAANGTSLLPPFRRSTGGISTQIYPGANREVNPAYAQAGLLQRVVYPTGGLSEFFYESNEYGFLGTQPLSAFPEYPMGDVVAEAFAGTTGDNPILPGQRRTVSEVFTIQPLPNEPAAMRPVRVRWDGYNPGVFDPHRPYVRIVNAANTPVYETTPRLIGAGNAPNEVVAEIMLPPGTYSLEAYASNPRPPYPLDPDNGQYGPPYARIRVDYQNPTSTQPIKKKIAGGTRVREIRDYARVNDPNYSARLFSYTWQDDAASSSGAVAGLPNYDFAGTQQYVIPYSPADIPSYDWCNYTLHLSQSPSIGFTQGSAVGYREVTVQTRGSQNGKTVYRFTPPGVRAAAPQLPIATIYPADYLEGLLIEQIDYVQNNGAMAPVSRTVNEHTPYERADITALVVQSDGSIDPNLEYDINHYRAGDGAFTAGHTQLTHTQHTRYNPITGASSTQDTYFQYDPTGQQLLSERRPMADGRTQVISHYYLNRYRNLPATLTGAVAAHAWPEVETTTAIEDRGALAVTQSDYQQWGAETATGKLRLQARGALKAATPLTDFVPVAEALTGQPDRRVMPTIIIDRYDANGNVLQLHADRGAPVARLWGYAQDHLMTAEVQNATYDQIAATSFEPNSKGRWEYLETMVAHTAAHTGEWSYSLSSSSPVRVPANLPAGDYELSVWAQGEVQLVDGTTPLAWHGSPETPLRNGYRAYRYRFHVAAGTVLQLIPLNGGVISIDELRLYPVGAQMTTLTHDPLVGVTSQTDPAGRTTTYEYDAFGRLLRTRDEQGRVRAEQQYRYTRP